MVIAVVRDLLPGAWLRGVGRVGACRRDGGCLHSHLSVAPEPCRSYRDALPPGLPQHCLAAVVGSEVRARAIAARYSEHFFIGRNIDRIVDHADCAALIVRIHLTREERDQEAVVRARVLRQSS